MAINYKNLTHEQRARIEELKQMSPEQWDKICKCCGICCLNKVQASYFGTFLKQIHYTYLACRQLNLKTKHCNVFDTRLECMHGECAKLDLDTIINDNQVPDSCGYVEYIMGPASHPANVDFSKIKSEQGYDTDAESLCEHIISGSYKWTKQR